MIQRLCNGTTGDIVTQRMSRATSLWDRLVGYLGRRDVDPNEGLWFDRCALIHTVGMRARIDVIFVDRQWRIVRVISRARANRIFHGGSRAVTTLELGPGVAERHELALGDWLRLE